MKTYTSIESGPYKPVKMLTSLSNMPNYVFFSLIFIYHILITLQGIDMLDEGFHVTFYQQFYNDPTSVQYAFVYWFSGLVGGSILKLFPFMGLLGLRIAGAAVSTLTVILTYNLLKKHISDKILKLSLVVLVLFISNDPKDLYYNNLSAFLYVSAGYFLYLGLTKKKNILIFLCGFVLGVNIFTRTPNLLGLGLGLVIFYNGIQSQESFSYQFRKFVVYVLGCLTAICLIILLMYSMGHLHIFIDSFNVIFRVSNTATKDDGVEGSYGIVSLLSLCGMQYFVSVCVVIMLAFFAFGWSFIVNQTSVLQTRHKLLFRVIFFLPVIAFSILIIRNGINNYKLIYFLTGLSLVFSMLLIFFEKKIEIKLLAMIGVYFMIVHPFGSAVGIFTVVPYSLWLSFPFAINYFCKLDTVNLNFRFNGKYNESVFSLGLNQRLLSQIKTFFLTVILLTCIYQVIRYPYFYDTHSRLKMTYSVDNKLMKGIYTSKEKAEVINELLTASEKYIKPNDYVLAYDLIPMYHFWTETRPYLRNPCPWFYTKNMFAYELGQASMKTNVPLPVVVMQTIKTVGFMNSRWPEVISDENYSEWARNKGRNKELNQFLEKNHYKTVWSNRVFKILVPENK